MTYATQQDLIDRFGETEIQQLTDADNTGIIDSAALAKTLTDTDAQINAYLLTVYTLPFATTPAALVRIACDIARYHLYDVRASDLVKERYDAAIDFLKNVSRGIASLGKDADTQSSAATSGGVKLVANDRVFSRKTLSDY